MLVETDIKVHHICRSLLLKYSIFAVLHCSVESVLWSLFFFFMLLYRD